MSITKRKLKSGETVYDVTTEYGTVDGKRERRKRTYRTLPEARKAETEYQRLRHAVSNRTGRITVSEYIDRLYWPVASRRLEATSLDTYKREIDKRIKPCLGMVMLDDLNRQKIQSMVDSCATESVGRKALSTLKTILNEAVGDGFMDSNPAMARYAMPKKGKKRDNGLVLTSFEQIDGFISMISKDAPEQVMQLVMTGLTMGLRPEERYALDHEDFDFKEGTVYVHGAYVVASSEHGGNQIKATKTEYSNRLIPMTAMFMDYFYWTKDGAGPWITNQNGGRLSPSTGRHMWDRYLDGHPKVPRVTLENMRHSFATSCLEAGMHVEDLSRILGHSDIGTTLRRYVKPDLTNMRKGIAKIPYFN